MKVTSENRPKVIFLDAVGTLFGVKSSVGEVYRNIAQQFGVEADALVLNQAFIQSFRNASPMAFPDIQPHEIPYHEYLWWEAIAIQTFSQAGVFEQFADFPAFFAALYRHFAIADPWFVYPDIRATLTQWRDQKLS